MHGLLLQVYTLLVQFVLVQVEVVDETAAAAHPVAVAAVLDGRTIYQLIQDKVILL
jgi:hypothetical protein